MFCDINHRGVLIEISQGKVKSLFFKIKRMMNIYKPVYQNLSHVSVDTDHNLSLLFFLDDFIVTWSVSINEMISGSWSLMGSLTSWTIFLSKERDFCLFSMICVFFSEIELALLLRSRLVISLPNTLLLLGAFLSLISIYELANYESSDLTV